MKNVVRREFKSLSVQPDPRILVSGIPDPVDIFKFCFSTLNVYTICLQFNPIRTGGGVNIDLPSPPRFLCSYFSCVKDIDFILIDFSSGGITHILSIKLFVYLQPFKLFSVYDFKKSVKS